MKVKIIHKFLSLNGEFDVISKGDKRYLDTPHSKILTDWFLLDCSNISHEKQITPHKHDSTVPAYWLQKNTCEIVAADSLLFKDIRVGERFLHDRGTVVEIIDISKLYGNKRLFKVKIIVSNIYYQTGDIQEFLFETYGMWKRLRNQDKPNEIL